MGQVVLDLQKVTGDQLTGCTIANPPNRWLSGQG
jgi:hypothetical protein